MPTYDFKTLSSYDFEVLVRDLLQEELQVRLESFKQGRDRGIDLRYSKTAEPRAAGANDLIIQCKHFASTPYQKLRRQLERDELPKVKQLRPSRYIVATSLGLTPRNKQAIVDIFNPYCRSVSDVFGNEDLNNLLGKFSAVETRHFKLWLTSTHVMNRVLHSRLFNESQVTRDRIRDRMKLYVENRSFPEAKRLLDTAHYCVIVGVPGIGKTTLAETLIVDHLARDYEVFVLTDDIRDAFVVHDSTRKQLFYYDDFLGQTGLADKLQKNEDQALIRFVDAVQSSGLTRLVLTTRDYIFNQARLTYERLARSRLDHQLCVVDLAAYTKTERAKILFNHVYFSRLPSEYKQALLVDRNYRKILGHPNFSPRIVEWMTDLSVHEVTPPSEYSNEFISNLSHPLRLWDHAFNSQLNNGSRHLLLCLATLPDPVCLADFGNAFERLLTSQAERFGFPRNPDDFRRAIKESEANFVSVSSPSNRKEVLLATFHNPSIRDFLYDYLDANMDYIRAMCESAVYFEQVLRLWAGFSRGGRAGETTPSTQTWLRANPDHLWEAVDRTFRAESCVMIWNQSRTDIERLKVIHERRVLFALSIRDRVPHLMADAILGKMVRSVYERLLGGKCDHRELNQLIAALDWSCIDAGTRRQSS